MHFWAGINSSHISLTAHGPSWPQNRTPLAGDLASVLVHILGFSHLNSQQGIIGSNHVLSRCHLQKIPEGTISFLIKDGLVCSSLLSLPSFAEDVDQCDPPVFHIINVEDKMEIFSVTTYQFGDVNQLYILMYNSSRTLLLINRKRDENTARSIQLEVDVKGESPGCDHNITYKGISWALLNPLSSMTKVKISSLLSVTNAKDKGDLE